MALFKEEHAFNLKAFNLKGNIILILPKGHSFPANIAHIRRIGNIAIIHNKNNSWQSFVEALKLFSDDYMDDRVIDKDLKQ